MKMENIIEIDLINEEDVLEKYNNNKANKDLINHIIHEADPFDKKEIIKIYFNNKTKLKVEKYIPIVKKSLQEEYNKCLREIDHNNINQFIYLLIGILLLFISTVFGDAFIFEEIFLIGGWVLIWETIEIELFADTELKKRRTILKKLSKSEIKELEDEENI